MTSVTRIEIGTRAGFVDSRAVAVERRVRAYLGLRVGAVRTRDVYHVVPALDATEAALVAREFAGPIVRQGAAGRLEDGPFDIAIAVGYRPGVTDPVGKSARIAVEDLLGRPLPRQAAVYSSRLYLFEGVGVDDARRIAREILANELIERVSIQTWSEWLASGPDLDVPRVADTATPPVEEIDLRSLDDAGLIAMSKTRILALSLDEMRAVRSHYLEAGRDTGRRAAGFGENPTDAELECIAQTWSEHCKHKIMNARIEIEEPGRQPEVIESLFKTYIRGTTERVDARVREREGSSWLVSVFHDNAGVIAATDRHHLVYKVETHNSPSALDPYGGAITGIVGVNRDPFGTGLGAELLANVWGYCFASPRHADPLPAGLLHPRRIREGVHRGVIDGGNQSGVPYARGFEVFDERFLGKPLVYCGTVGKMPVSLDGWPAHEKRARPGDRIVMVGGRVGKDGIHGATFSSAELTETSPVQAVQIGDPITQKMMFDFLLEARDRGLYSSITDNGAGGLSSSVGEMARATGGARLDLAKAPLKYQGLAPWEILVSEAQERMTVAVPPASLADFLALANLREVEATDLGAFTDDGVFHVVHGDVPVCYLPLAFLHDGDPDMRLRAVFSPAEGGEPAPQEEPPRGLATTFLARENLASNEEIARTYDHGVKALSVVRPWIGLHADVPADATVLQIDHEDCTGYALAEGIFPTYSDIDAHAMAQAGVDLAVRRLIAAGARFDRIAALDNYCWPDPLPSPDNPDAAHKLAQLVRASRGLSEICEAYGVPLISGKDSMKNDAVIGGRRISVPPTLLVSAIGLLDDVRRAVTLEPRRAGQRVLLFGETKRELGGTEWAAARGERFLSVPRCEPAAWAQRYRDVAALIQEGVIAAAHAPGRGGLLPALFRIAQAAGLGLDVDLARAPAPVDPGWEGWLFSESCGRLVLVVEAVEVPRVLDRLAGHPVAEIGSVDAARSLRIAASGRVLIDEQVADIAAAWKRTLNNLEEEA